MTKFERALNVGWLNRVSPFASSGCYSHLWPCDVFCPLSDFEVRDLFGPNVPVRADFHWDDGEDQCVCWEQVLALTNQGFTPFQIADVVHIVFSGE